MPLDPSISLQVRQYEPPNMLAQYAQVMGIQNAQSQNRLAQVQYENAIREQQNDIATQDAFKGNDRAAAINALYQRGLYKPALVLEKAEQERKKSAGEIEKNEVDTAAKRLDALSAMIAPLANDPNLTHQKVMATGQTLAQMGILKPGWEAQVPQNAMELPAFVRQVALSTQRGRESLQMLLPKAEKVDTGAGIGFVNTNPLAGQIGSGIAGAPVIAKEQSPESRASTGLGYANLAETKAEHERAAKKEKYGQPVEVTGPDGKPRLVMQEKVSGNLVDPVTKQPVAGIGPKVGETSQKQIAGVENTRAALGEYKAALSNWKAIDAANPNARARMGTIYNNALLQAKEAYNLGVLNGPDYMILQSVLTDPASLAGGITSTSALKEQADKLDEIMDRIGTQVSATQSGQQPQRRASDKSLKGFKVLGVEGK